MAAKTVVTKSQKLQTQITPIKVMGNIPFVANTKQTLQKLDRTMNYRCLYLRLTGSITTTGTSTTANIGAGDEWAAVSLIEIVANGGNVLRSITGEQLAVMAYLFAGYVKQLNTLSGASGTYNFDSTLPLWFCLPAGFGNPIDTTLAANLLSDLFIRITWGPTTAINNASGTTTSANTQITVGADQSFQLDKSIVNPYAMTLLQGFQISNIIQSTAGGTQGYNFQIPVGQTYIWMLLNAKNTGTTQDNVLAFTGANQPAGLVIQSGTNQLYSCDPTIQRQSNGFLRGVVQPNFSLIFNNTQNLYNT